MISITIQTLISKIILRYSNLSTTERYFGNISDVEAMKWIDNVVAGKKVHQNGR